VRCPVCQSSASLQLVRRGVPVHQNLVLRDTTQARAHPQGDIELHHCDSCGMVYNAAFDPYMLRYDARYDNTQSCSPAFGQYMDERVQRMISDGVQHCHVVEVGCGQGDFIRRLCAAGHNTGTGFDPAYRGPSTTPRMRFVREYYGPDQTHIPADAIVCRHVIEHVPDPVGLVTAIRRAVTDDAVVYFETPDLTWILDNQVIWDVFYEHCNYFTPSSLRQVFERAGFSNISVERCFDGQYLWLRAQPGHAAQAPVPSTIGASMREFVASEGTLRTAWRDFLDHLSGPVALWGAGAKGTTLANLVDADQQRITCLVDVNPAKQGQHVAGSGHPIVGPSDLAELDVQHVIVMNPTYVDEIAALCRGLDLQLHPPEAPCASPLTQKLAS
jgi:SAM-dependent methyltransferase